MTDDMEDGATRYRVENDVAYLTFDRARARNALSWRMYEQLAAGLARVEADDAVRVCVLRGAGGKAFIAGTDIEQFTAFASGEDGLAYERKIETYIDALERVRVPTVAVVEGLAVGGGLAIANSCDIRIATVGARVGAPIARTLGNCLSPRILRRLTATLGVGMVKRLLLLAEMPAAELMPPGYLAAVVEPAGLDDAVARVCAQLAGHAPLTIRATREAMRRLSDDPRAEADDLIRACYGSADFAEGVRSFLAKRPAAWTGR